MSFKDFFESNIHLEIYKKEEKEATINLEKELKEDSNMVFYTMATLWFDFLHDLFSGITRWFN